MGQKYLPGYYIDYPCCECGRAMKLKDNLQKLVITQEATIECPDCKVEKKYTVNELKSIINAQF